VENFVVHSLKNQENWTRFAQRILLFCVLSMVGCCFGNRNLIAITVCCSSSS